MEVFHSVAGKSLDISGSSSGKRNAQLIQRKHRKRGEQTEANKGRNRIDLELNLGEDGLGRKHGGERCG